MLERALQAGLNPASLRSAVLRKLLTRCPRSWLSALSYKTLLMGNVVERPSYGYCMYHAAILARQLGHKTISAIEFGVAGGNGLVAAESHSKEISKELGVQFQIYGFDTGEGLPAPNDYRDLPFLWRHGFYAMDQDALRRRLETSQLVLGNVRETCAEFFPRYRPAPIGCIFWDLDFYSSTVEAFELLGGDHGYFLPRVWMYFDDIVGGSYSDFTGERLAIAEFNARSRRGKLSQDYNVSCHPMQQIWKHQVFVYHDFTHPEYCTLVGPADRQLPLSR